MRAWVHLRLEWEQEETVHPEKITAIPPTKAIPRYGWGPGTKPAKHQTVPIGEKPNASLVKPPKAAQGMKE